MRLPRINFAHSALECGGVSHRFGRRENVLNTTPQESGGCAAAVQSASRETGVKV
jgi:hypothetical protein